MQQKHPYIQTIIISFLIMVTAISCRSTKSTVTQEEILRLDSLVQNKQFTITSDVANPQVTAAMQQVLNAGLMPPGSGAGNISLIGNQNHLTISGDSITSYLPYFGEARMSVDYGGTNSAIAFKGVVKEYKVVQNKDHSYRITFIAKSNAETFDVSITLFPNLKSDIHLNGNSRSAISYVGTVNKITLSETESSKKP